MQEKNYLNGITIKEKKFDNGGTILNCWVRIDDFIKELHKISKDGSANIVISERKTPSEKGVSHSVYEDTFKPEAKPAHYEETEDDLPF